MRTALLLGTLLSLSACSSDTKHVDAGTFDFAVADLAGGIGCRSFAGCIEICLAGSSSPTFASCVTSCSANAKNATVVTKYDAARQCAQDYCQGGNDAGASYKCTFKLDAGSTTQGSLVDAAGQPAGACNACLGNAFAALDGTACSDASSPDCNPSQCTEKVTTCTEDTP